MANGRAALAAYLGVRRTLGATRMSEQRPRWRRYDDPETQPPDPLQLAVAWVAEYSYDQSHPNAEDDSREDDWVSPKERLWSLVATNYQAAWPVTLLILQRVPDDGLWEVGHEVVRDIVCRGWPSFMPTVEEEARQNARLRAALRGASCCSSLTYEVLQRIGDLPGGPPGSKSETPSGQRSDS